MYIGLIIENLMSERKVKKINLYNYLGIAKNTLNDYLTGRTSMTVEMVQKIADFFKVPISYFFEDTPKGNITPKGGEGSAMAVYGHASTGDTQKEVEHLKQLLEEKERLIQVLMRNNN
jgi:transcriptional regulator with XRE-family HTH domain